LLAAYRARSWDEAEKRLDANEEAAASYGLGKLYARLRASIRACREQPPAEDWEGVTTAETK
jgi:hypothetical protein